MFDEQKKLEAQNLLNALAKPPGSLGLLEHLAAQLAGIQGTTQPQIKKPRVIVFGGDHGITAESVSPYPSSVTALMIKTMCSGESAVTVLARSVSAEVDIVNAGCSAALPDWPTAHGIHFWNTPVKKGNDNFLL